MCKRFTILITTMTEHFENANRPNPLINGGGMLFDVIHYAGDRIKVAGDILDFLDFFTSDDTLPYDESVVAKRITNSPDAIPLLREFRDELTKQDDFTHTALEQLMQRFMETKQIKTNQIIHALRVAVTGKSVGLGMFETLEILGKERVLRRIGRALTLT